VSDGGAVAAEQVAADADLDRRDAVGAVGVEQVEHGARVSEDELLHHPVLPEQRGADELVSCRSDAPSATIRYEMLF